MSQKYILQVFVTLKNTPQKWFRVISEELLKYLKKTDVRPLKLRWHVSAKFFSFIKTPY